MVVEADHTVVAVATVVVAAVGATLLVVAATVVDTVAVEALATARTKRMLSGETTSVGLMPAIGNYFG